MGCHSQWGKPSSFSLFDALKLYVKEDVKKEEVGVMVAFLASCPDPVVVSSSHLGCTHLPSSLPARRVAAASSWATHWLSLDRHSLLTCPLLRQTKHLPLLLKFTLRASGSEIVLQNCEACFWPQNNKINFLCHRWHYTDCPLMCVCYTTRQWVLDKQLILICLLRAHCKCSTSDGGRKTQFFSYVSPGLFLYNLINEWHNDDAAS